MELSKIPISIMLNILCLDKFSFPMRRSKMMQSTSKFMILSYQMVPKYISGGQGCGAGGHDSLNAHFLSSHRETRFIQT